MRALLIPVLALVLAACGKGDQAANNQNVADSLTSDSIVSNDVTAIDAVTGDAANMAADVDMNFGNLEPKGNDSGASKDESSRPERPAPKKSESPAPETSNSVANTTANSE
jgi:hypothetical protein